MRPAGIVTLLSDFGTDDPYVGVMKGAVLRVHPKVVLVDLGHAVPPQDIVAGAFWLAAAIDAFPPGTVHVAVVDPGVGTGRRLLVAFASQCWWLAPDNGLLARVLAVDPAADVREIDVERLQLTPRSSTFHGRDILAPVAGWLASGRYGFTALGPRITDPVVGEGHSGEPQVVHVDGYGNLITNVVAATMIHARGVRIGGLVVPLHRTYADVPSGHLLALVGSYGLLEVAQNGGSAARTLGLARGAPIELVLA